MALIGFHLQTGVAGAGITLVARGWSRLSLRLTGLVRGSVVPDRVHPRLMARACSVGAVALWVAALALLLQQERLLRSVTQAALWCFVAPMFAVASHRMIPYFSASALTALDAWRPQWWLWLMVSVLWLGARSDWRRCMP